MNTTIDHTLILLATLCLLTQSALAAPSQDQQALVQARVSEIAERLALSDEQEAQVRPIVTAGVEAQLAVLERYGIAPEGAVDGSMQRPSRRQAFQLRQDLEAVRRDTQAQLEQVLSDAQLAEFSAVQAERQAQMRERMRGGR